MVVSAPFDTTAIISNLSWWSTGGSEDQGTSHVQSSRPIHLILLEKDPWTLDQHPPFVGICP